MSHVLAIVVNTGASSRRPCQAWSPCCQPVFNCYRSAQGKITSQFGNSILLNFRQVVKGFGLSISALLSQTVPCGSSSSFFIGPPFPANRAAMLQATGGIIHPQQPLSRDSMTNFQYWSRFV